MPCNVAALLESSTRQWRFSIIIAACRYLAGKQIGVCGRWLKKSHRKALCKWQQLSSQLGELRDSRDKQDPETFRTVCLRIGVHCSVCRCRCFSRIVNEVEVAGYGLSSTCAMLPVRSRVGSVKSLYRTVTM